MKVGEEQVVYRCSSPQAVPVPVPTGFMSGGFIPDLYPDGF